MDYLTEPELAVHSEQEKTDIRAAFAILTAIREARKITGELLYAILADDGMDRLTFYWVIGRLVRLGFVTNVRSKQLGEVFIAAQDSGDAEYRRRLLEVWHDEPVPTPADLEGCLRQVAENSRLAGV